MLLWNKHISIILFVFTVPLRAGFKGKQRASVTVSFVWEDLCGIAHPPPDPAPTCQQHQGSWGEESGEGINYLCHACARKSNYMVIAGVLRKQGSKWNGACGAARGVSKGCLWG